MVNVYEENLTYLNYMGYTKDEIDEIMSTFKFENAFVYNFIDILDEFDIEHFKLYDMVFSDTLNQSVFVYSIECNYEQFAFMSPLVEIPDNQDPLEVRFAIFLTEDIIENELFYKHVLGHELAHIDFYDLPEYDDHECQNRYPIIESYCDIKSLDLVETDEDKYEILNLLMESIKSEDMYYDVVSLREYEIRTKFMRLAIKGKLNAEMVGKYIKDNYIRHMEYLSENMKKYDEFKKSKLNIDELSFKAFCYQEQMERDRLNKYFI